MVILENIWKIIWTLILIKVFTMLKSFITNLMNAASNLSNFCSTCYPVIEKLKKTWHIKILYYFWIKNEIKNKHTLKTYRKFPITYRELYKNVRKDLNKTLDKVKRCYYRDESNLNKNDSKQIWNVVGEILGNNEVESVIYEINLENESIIDAENIENVANTYFTNIGTSLVQMNNSFIFLL